MDTHITGNPAYTAGVLTIRGSEVPDMDDGDGLPGLTQALVDNTVFTNNTCSWWVAASHVVRLGARASIE